MHHDVQEHRAERPGGRQGGTSGQFVRTGCGANTYGGRRAKSCHLALKSKVISKWRESAPGCRGGRLSGYLGGESGVQWRPMFTLVYFFVPRVVAEHFVSLQTTGISNGRKQTQDGSAAVELWKCVTCHHPVRFLTGRTLCRTTSNPSSRHRRAAVHTLLIVF